MIFVCLKSFYNGNRFIKIGRIEKNVLVFIKRDLDFWDKLLKQVKANILPAIKS